MLFSFLSQKEAFAKDSRRSDEEECNENKLSYAPYFIVKFATGTRILFLLAAFLYAYHSEQEAL